MLYRVKRASGCRAPLKHIMLHNWTSGTRAVHSGGHVYYSCHEVQKFVSASSQRKICDKVVRYYSGGMRYSK